MSSSLSFEFTNHEIYFRIASEHLCSALKSDKFIKNKFGFHSWEYKGETIPNDYHTTFSDLNAFIICMDSSRKDSIVAIVFYALAAEAFINYYILKNKKTKRYIKEYNKNPDTISNISETVSKWITETERILKEKRLKFDLFSMNSQEIKLLINLMEKRNKLVHHKAQLLNESSLRDINTDPNRITLEDARNGREDLRNCVKKLSAYDSSVSPDWVDFKN